MQKSTLKKERNNNNNDARSGLGTQPRYEAPGELRVKIVETQ